MSDETLVLDYTRAPWDPEGENFERHSADLTTPQGCQAELQFCTRGLAYLDHLYGIVLDELTALETEWDAINAEASEAIRKATDDKLTAGEVKALIAAWVAEHKPDERDKYQRYLNRKAKVERWQRTAEKRLSAAQSALNGHEQLGRYGGGN